MRDRADRADTTAVSSMHSAADYTGWAGPWRAPGAQAPAEQPAPGPRV